MSDALSNGFLPRQEEGSPGLKIRRSELTKTKSSVILKEASSFCHRHKIRFPFHGQMDENPRRAPFNQWVRGTRIKLEACLRLNRIALAS
jgi:hypothetical protein